MLFKHLNRTTLAAMTAAALVTQAPVAVANDCKVKTTAIHKIQGSGKQSPLEGKKVTVSGIVSAVMPDLGGYYLLQDLSQWDDNDKTSEGLFVADTKHKPSVGDRLVLTGKVSEIEEVTHIDSPSKVKTCAQNQKVKSISLTLPMSDSWEQYEGMLVHFNQDLTISENYSFARYGQLLLSNGRLFQPSNVARPGPEADKVKQHNRINQIVLDDGSSKKNPAMTFGHDHDYRVGNLVGKVKGVVHYSFGKYMIEPTQQPQFVRANPRQDKPAIKQGGNIRVASLNLLNYFNGNGKGKGFPGDRGASSYQEFKRQNDKTLAAMLAINADIYGLMELENDGFGKNSAIATLTKSLSTISGVEYKYLVPKGNSLGSGNIAVGMIYNPKRVVAVGDAITMAKAPFGVKSRQPIAQTFKPYGSKDKFTVVVNHFKSKGGCPKDKKDLNANQGDGQACWNQMRLQSSKQLLSWLATDPTGSNDKDVLIIGDLNAYAKEDPIIEIEKSGYVNLVEKFQGRNAYSYIFRGLSGYLDHALASNAMVNKVVDTIEWHINADEMTITDYNLEGKSPAQQRSLFKDNAFRSSDHDPVVVELKFALSK